jgi:hypothetical protein
MANNPIITNFECFMFFPLLLPSNDAVPGAKAAHERIAFRAPRILHFGRAQLRLMAVLDPWAEVYHLVHRGC